MAWEPDSGQSQTATALLESLLRVPGRPGGQRWTLPMASFPGALWFFFCLAHSFSSPQVPHRVTRWPKFSAHRWLKIIRCKIYVAVAPEKQQVWKCSAKHKNRKGQSQNGARAGSAEQVNKRLRRAWAEMLHLPSYQRNANHT